MSTLEGSNLQRPYPLSPPPHTGPKKQPEMSYQQPRTPQSPSQPTSASSEKSSSFEMATQSVDTSFPTPANSVKGSISSISSSDAISAMDGKAPVENMRVDDTSNKRKREVDDSGDRDQKKLHVEDRRLGIEDLHLDVGKKYLLCRTPHPEMQPNLRQDLFDLYSLNGIASKVARVLPNGEKNGLRKTYKGKIKDLGLSGKFDVVVHEEDASGGLLNMLREPEMEWSMQNRQGKEIEKGLPENVRNNLTAAMTMSKGVIPKSSWDSSVLGELDIPEKKAPTAPAMAKTHSSGQGSAARPGISSSGVPRSGSGKGDIARPKRNVKKRGYEENSFEGYGEGYVDDDMVDAGYSTGEGEGLSQKRRKKTTPTHNYPGPMRHNSYGPGMVGA